MRRLRHPVSSAIEVRPGRTPALQIAAIGTSEMVRPIYEVLRHQVGALDQAAIFHPDRSDELKVAENVPAHAFARAGDDHAGIELVPLTVDTPDEESAIITELGAIHFPQKD